MTWVGLVLLWGGFAVVIYTYVGYPALLGLVAKFCRRPVQRVGKRPDSISIVVSVRNGEGQIARRLAEFIALTHGREYQTEILVVSDGSTDSTAEVANQFVDQGVRVIELADGVGKAAAITQAIGQSQSDVIVLADVRQRWCDDAIDAMIDNFEDPNVGAVSGELVLESRPGVLAGVGAYWRYEKWIRKTESSIHSQIGVTGAIAAVRRECFRAIPGGTILDDVYWPMQVGMQRKRIVFEPRAKAYDLLPEQTSDEFRRKVRTLTGNFQLCRLSPTLLVPIVNPLWGRFVSHKLLRLACPWAMMLMAVGALVARDPVSLTVLVAMIGMTIVGVIGLKTGRGGRLVSAVASFVMLNAAATVAFFYWVTGQKTEKIWVTQST